MTITYYFASNPTYNDIVWKLCFFKSIFSCIFKIHTLPGIDFRGTENNTNSWTTVNKTQAIRKHIMSSSLRKWETAFQFLVLLSFFYLCFCIFSNQFPQGSHFPLLFLRVSCNINICDSYMFNVADALPIKTWAIKRFTCIMKSQTW